MLGAGGVWGVWFSDHFTLYLELVQNGIKCKLEKEKEKKNPPLLYKVYEIAQTKKMSLTVQVSVTYH